MNNWRIKLDLRGTDLRKENLMGANLRGANLQESNLEGVDLGGANLEGANLRDARLDAVNLVGANLQGANLEGVDLRGACLPDGTNWTEDTDVTRFTNPDHPDFWENKEEKVPKLEIPARDIPSRVVSDGDLPKMDSLSLSLLERRLWPGSYSSRGFMGRNESLLEIIERDRRTMERLELSYDILAIELRHILNSCRQNNESVVMQRNTQDGLLEIKVEIVTYFGYQECPWLECNNYYVYGSDLDWTLTNLKTGEKLRGPGMIVHLIAEHHFFEGFESYYRVDPEQLARFLGLVR
jgi:hypothetical protein